MTSSITVPHHRRQLARHASLSLGLLLLLAFVGQPLSNAAAATYFVNDTNTVNDLWCTAVGDDINDGLTTATPKATVQAILDTYDLDGGDQVRIDTGTYLLTNDITVTLSDSGVATALVAFVASPYGVTIDRSNNIPPSAVWYLNAAQFVQLTTTNDSTLAGVAQGWMRATGGARGIRVTGQGCVIRRVEAVSNLFQGVYIEGAAATNTVVENCFLRQTTDPSAGTGLLIASANRATVRNCTITENGRYGIRMTASTLAHLTNNIVVADGSGDFALSLESNSALSGADFNLLHSTNGATLAFLNGTNHTTLATWRIAAGRDSRSLSRDPLFVNPAADNYRLRSTAGSYKTSSFTADATTSPGVDTGSGDVGLETAPNSTPLHAATTGKRNLGAYGGTELASRTPTNRQAWLYEPIGGEQYLNQATPVSIRWTWVGSDWSSGDQTLRLEQFNQTDTYVGVTGAANVSVSAGSYSWDISGLLAAPIYRVRVLRNSDNAVVDISPGLFRIGRNIVYYVNDGATLNDLWTTATGSDTNNALTPSSPRTTVQSLLDSYDLDGGDQVRLDTGLYNLTNDITITSADSGLATALVSFVASPYGVTFNRNETNVNSACWLFGGVQFAQLTTTNDSSLAGIAQRYVQLTGARYGVWFAGNDNRATRIDAVSNALAGVLVNGAGASNNVIENALLRDTLDATGAGLQISSASRTTVRNSTMAGNAKYGLRIITGTLAHLTNNILIADGVNDFAISLESSSTLAGSDFNLLLATNGAFVGSLNGTNHTTLTAWRTASGRDARSLTRDPLFVSPATGNYRLQSTAGSYKTSSFTADANSSPGIDTGFGDLGAETAPNSTPLHPSTTGKRNLGAYGGTEFASRTPTTRFVWLYEPIGGEQYLNQTAPVSVRWTWVGTDWASGDQTLTLQQYNETETFLPVPGATNLSVNAGSYTWDISGLLPTPLYRVRLLRNLDAGLAAQSETSFRIGRGITYYVNDSSLANDLWASASGSDANTGLTPGTPKATVQSVLETFDLDGGDQVRIDTGTYNLTNDITVSSTQSGVATAMVSFVASPYGVTFQRGNTNAPNAAWYLNGAQFVQLTTTNDATFVGIPQRWMRLTAGARGVRVAGSSCQISRIEAVSNSFQGVYLDGSAASNNVVENCLISATTDPAAGTGILLLSGARNTIRNCTVVDNAKFGLRLVGATLVSLTNNIVVTDGPGIIGASLESGSTLAGADFNLWHTTNNALLASLNGTNLATLAAWRTATGRDSRSLQGNPMFVAPTTGNYRLQSTAGSYKVGTFSADAGNSPGIDTGFGEIGLETAPNSTPLHGVAAGRRNLGAYGGTELASRTPTNRLVWLYEPIGGEEYLNQLSPVSVRWTWVGTDWSTGNQTLDLQYLNEYESYVTLPLGTNVAVNSGSFSWDISSVLPTPIYRARLLRNFDSTLVTASGAPFRIGRSVTYYVNDGSTTNDLWATATGADINNALTPGFPKASVQSVLNTYDLDGGDQVRIDTGSYTLTNDITVTAADSGVSTALVSFIASPYGVTFQRNETNVTSAAWYFNAASFVQLTTTNDSSLAGPQRFAQVTGGRYGVWVAGNDCRITRMDAVSNLLAGVYVSGVIGTNTVVENTLLRDSYDPTGAGFYVAAAARATAQNCTFVNNARYGVRLVGATLANLTNNVFVAGGTNNSAVSVESGASLAGSDFNLWYLTNGAHLGFINNAKLTSLAQWRTTTGQDARSLERDPLFVAASLANFNVQSTAGSYKAGAFTADAADSPCIDTGSGSSGLEPAPNATPLHGATTGKRNLGAFGGTEFASLTPTNRLLWLYESVGNEYYLNQNTNITIRWTWVGTDWAGGDQTVGIQHFDEYENFVTIPGAANVSISAGQHSWNISALLPTPIYRLQLLRNFDSAVAATSATPFRIGRVVTYYVNDGATTNDLWATAPGADTNNALTPGFPKASVQSVLDTYDLDPGDLVRIDTGTYLLTNDIVIASGDGGAPTALVSFVASPYGVTFDRNETSFNTACWYFNGAQNVLLTTTNDSTLAGVPQRWLRATGARYGVWLASSDNQISRVEAASNLFYGVFINGTAASNNVVENAVLRDNYDSAGAGAYVSSAVRTTIRNSTLVANGRYGVRGVSTSSLYLTNNIVSASGAAGLGISLESGAILAGSDYNLWHTTNNAALGHLTGTTLADLVAWRSSTGRDSNSFERNPLFVDPATGNYHVQSTAGSYKTATFTPDSDNSIAIDTGWGEAGLEPVVNVTPLHGSGTGRRNLGAYGGTDLASLTPTNRLAWLYEPLGRASYLNQAIPISIRWTWVGTDWSSGDQTLNLQYFNEYATYTTVALGTNVAVNSSNFTWNISGLLPTPIYRVQLTRNSDSTPTDQSAFPFRIGRNIVYYVNDSSLTNDLWATATGNDVNNALTPAFPKTTAQSVLDTYDLDGGDSIRFDTGYYPLTNDITVTTGDSGVATALVSFVASPYGVTFDRANLASPNAAWYFNGVQFAHLTTTNDSSLAGVAQRWLQLTGGARGIRITGPGCTISRTEAVSNQFQGIYIEGSAATNTVIENCLAHHTSDTGSGAGLLFSAASRGTIRNTTVADNGRYGIRLIGSTLIQLTNTIAVADGAGDVALAVESGSTLAGANYNLLYATNSASLATLGGTNYTTLAGWRTASGRDSRSLARDPLFVSPATGNYRLQSTAGSYKISTFTADAGNSPGLDTGFGTVDLETAPNSTPLHGATTGKRNLGAFGGTELASRTPTNRLVWLYEPSGSEQYPISGGPISIRWTWVGTDWTGGNTLAIDYSNSEVSFTNVIGGAAVAVNTGSFSWDITVLQRDPAFQVRLTSNEAGTTTDITPTPFAIGGKLFLYVNDASLVNDKWVTVIGNDANDGTATNRPKATLQNLLTAYDLQPGDEVYVDTGTYNLTNDIVITAADGGTGSNPVRFFGSNRGPGTILNRGDTNGTTAVFDTAASGLIIENFRLTGAARGYVHNNTARSNTLINTFLYANTRGIEVLSTNALTILNSTLADNTLAGIDATAATNTPTIFNTILWNNGDDLIAATAAYSLIEDGDAGPGNTAGNPHFVNAAARDYRLLGPSAAIDAGTNLLALLPAEDIENQPRIFAGIVDIGADERPWAVSVSASTNTIYDFASATAILTVTRDGSYFREITVPFTITGTASNGVDYNLVSSPVTLSNGASSATFPLTPINDLIVEGPETATFTLAASAIYNLTNPTAATVTLTETPADVHANKTGPALVNANGTINYTVTVTNAGPGIALGVAVIDSLPAGVTFQSASAGGTNSGGTVAWPTLTALPFGDSTNLTVTVTAPNTGTLTNTIASTAGTPDLVASNNNGTSPNGIVITTVTELADVQATKSGLALIDAGTYLVYTITVTNAGPSPAQNVAIVDTLPPAAAFFTASHGGTNAAGLVGWPQLTLPALGAVTYTVTVLAPGTGILSNTIASTSTTIDLMPANNDGTSPSALVTTVIHELADVTATKNGLTNTYFGDNLTYTITVTNAGPSIATSVMVADSLPAGVNFLSASAGGTNAAGTVGWPVIPSLPVNSGTNFTVTVATTATGMITNTIISTSVTDDPNAGNNDGTGVGGRVVTVVNHIADVVTLKAGPLLVIPGSNMVYQLTITNAGPTVATNVTVVDYLPGNVTFVSASAGGTNTAGTIGWPAIPFLNVGDVTNLTVTVTAPLTGSVTNRAANGAAVFDPLPGNNDGTAGAATVVTIIDVLADSDSDEIPNWWELTYGLNPYNATDASLDSDGDGFSNLQEYLAGTNPINGQESLRINTVFVDGVDVHIRFTTVNGKQYKLDARNSLETGTWTELPGTINGDGNEQEAVDLGGLNSNRYFYRIRLYIAP